MDVRKKKTRGHDNISVKHKVFAATSRSTLPVLQQFCAAQNCCCYFASSFTGTAIILCAILCNGSIQKVSAGASSEIRSMD